MKRNDFFWQKVFRFEYWPYWVFYAPFLLVGLYYAIRSKRFLYFTAVNPKMHLGGLFNYSKGELLLELNPEYIPTTKLYEEASLDSSYYLQGVDFPFIFKPDFGERGKDVALVHSKKEWEEIYSTIQTPFLIQEYIDSPIELGILYYRTPDNKSGILSVVSKGFLTVVGDGESTFKDLIDAHIRASGRLDYLYDKFSSRLEEILPIGKSVILEEIGNHCRGTKFINSNALINEKLVKVFDKIAVPLKDFYYGRFDLRVNSLEDLYAGKSIKIVEVNGVNSEAAHIYDPNMRLSQAYKDVWKQQKLVYSLAKQNILNGVKTPSLGYFIQAVISYWKA